MKSRRFILSLLLLALCPFVFADENEDQCEEELRILFIGNSYTSRIKRQIRDLFKTMEKKAELEYICPGGTTLAKHAQSDKVQEALTEKEWDFVVLQEQSQIPSFPDRRDEFFEAAKELDKLIKKGGAETVFYMT